MSKPQRSRGGLQRFILAENSNAPQHGVMHGCLLLVKFCFSSFFPFLIVPFSFWLYRFIWFCRVRIRKASEPMV